MPNTAASRLTLTPYSEAAVIQAARSALAEVGGKVSIGFVFASADYYENLPDFLELIQLHGHVPLLAGCSGSGVIGTNREAEKAAGFSLLLLHLPETEIHSCVVSASQADTAGPPQDWHRITGVKPGEVDAWIAKPAQQRGDAPATPLTRAEALQARARLVQHRLDQLRAERADELDPETRHKAQFYLRQLTSALSPSWTAL